MSKVKAPISLRSLQRAAVNAVPGKDGASAKILGATAIFAAGVGVAVHAETTTSLPAVQVDAPKEKPRPAAALSAVSHRAAKPRSARRADAPHGGSSGNCCSGRSNGRSSWSLWSGRPWRRSRQRGPGGRRSLCGSGGAL